MKNRVVITGIGILSPIGIGVEEFWKATLAGESGVGEISLFDAAHYATRIAAEVKNFNPADFMLPEVYRKIDRFAQFGVAAAKMAIVDAKLEGTYDLQQNHIPVIIGSGLGGSLFHEEQIFQLIGTQEPKKVLSSSVPRIAPNAVSAFIAMQYKFRGTNLTISTACSSGGNAIALAAQQIENGITDIVITGGVECPISPFTYAAYQSLRVLSKGLQGAQKASRPFDKKRDGFVLGEGAGILVLENYEKACARKASIYAELKGYASNCGAYHMAAPDPTGEDAAAVMREAIAHAGISLEDIAYVNAHGTATQANDICESKAINIVFEKSKKRPLVSSTKSQIGHTIGAAGAIGAIAAILAVQYDRIPPNINCDELDEQCNINVVQGEKALKAHTMNAISNSFGFGSNNTALVVGKINSNKTVS